MKTDSIEFSEFNGLSDSLWSGIKGSFYKFIGLDARSKPGAMQAQQALAKHSGSTITEFCKVALTTSTGKRLWFSSTSGKIWYEDGAGAYSLVYTTAPTSGGAGCLGAYEYNGNVYWATQSYLHYVPVANVSNFAGVQLNWQAFTVGNTTYHPMMVQNAQLFIGDGNQMAKVNSSGTFTEGGTVLNIIAPLVITSIQPVDIDLVIGTIISANVNYCQIIRWDTIQTTWQYAEPVWEAGVNSLFWDGNNLLANCGVYGKLYSYNGQFLIPYKRVPGTFSPTATAKIFPNAIGLFQGVAIFGVSQITGNACEQAVYGLGSYDKKYAEILSVDFPISTGNLNGIQIGAILVDGLDVYVSWYDSASGGNYGVDKLNWSAKYASAYLETMRLGVDQRQPTTTERMFANYQSMPASCSVVFKYYKNDDTSPVTPSNAVKDDVNLDQVFVEEAIDFRMLRLYVGLTVSANNSPVVELIGLTPANP